MMFRSVQRVHRDGSRRSPLVLVSAVAVGGCLALALVGTDTAQARTIPPSPSAATPVIVETEPPAPDEVAPPAAAPVVPAPVDPDKPTSVEIPSYSPVDLGTAVTFGVFGGTTVTNTGTSYIDGDVGIGSDADVTGLLGASVGGAIHLNNATATQAHVDLTKAYTYLAAQVPTMAGLGELSGLTLPPGVYEGPALTIDGSMKLNGDATSLWVFQSASTLVTQSGSEIVITGGATSANVFWQVGSSATLGTNSTFIGTLIAHRSIAATTGVTVDGRLLTVTGAATLDGNVLMRPGPIVIPPVVVEPPVEPPIEPPIDVDPPVDPPVVPPIDVDPTVDPDVDPGSPVPPVVEHTTPGHHPTFEPGSTHPASLPSEYGTGSASAELAYTGDDSVPVLRGATLALLLGAALLALERRLRRSDLIRGGRQHGV